MPEDLAAVVGGNLRDARAARGLSQQGLAAISGVSQSHISHFESGKREPLLRNLIRLAQALRLSTDSLLGLAPLPAAEPPASARKGKS